MAKLSVLTWIGNAAAVLCGRHGAITTHTQHAGCSRQTAYDHAQRVQQVVAEVHAGAPTRAQLLHEVEHLREENRQLWQALEDTIDFPQAQQQRFAVTAAALGISDRQITVLFALLLAAHAPSRATIGRWVKCWAERAGRLLQHLDACCASLVRTVCLDEIFCRRQPVLVGVEPHSFACILAQRTPDRSGATWAQVLQPWNQLRRVVCDAGTGLRKGLELYQQQRAQAGPPPPLEEGLDLFHTCHEAQRVLRQVWQAAEGVWQRWDVKQRAFDHLRGRGVHCQSPAYRSAARQAEKAHSKAKQVLTQAEQQEEAWHRARAAFELLRADGSVNDRAQAEADLAAALPHLSGPRWAKVRNFLQDRRSLNFLDGFQQALVAAAPQAEVRAALVRLWQIRHRGQQTTSAVGIVAAAVQEQVCQQLRPDWSERYRRVATVFSRTVRASSVVECMNSVWRMHQARHRGLSQGLLDLKRLWWNSRAFAEGKRRGRCPYQLLGLRLPTYDAWELLQCDPDELTQQLSTLEPAA